ncbi:hypothetical protein BHE74_00054726 [Ensete ventricosum]|nr:hypothetical protein BHE74_00054726 [Ensete ventricosum]
MTHHAAAPLATPAVLVVRRAPAGRGCRPYLCQVGCTAPGVLRTSGRSVTLVWPRQRLSCPRVGKALYRAIRIDPPVDQYVDRPLLGGTVEIDRRRSISIGITEGGRKKKREKPGSPARSVARGRFLLPVREKGTRRHRPFVFTLIYIILYYIILSGMLCTYRSVPGTISYQDEFDMLVRTGMENLDHCTKN